MTNLELIVSALTHQLYGALLRRERDGGRDRGAVTLEQVLWFVAAAVSVAVVAGILWGKIRDEAEAPVETMPPLAP